MTEKSPKFGWLLGLLSLKIRKGRLEQQINGSCLDSQNEYDASSEKYKEYELSVTHSNSANKTVSGVKKEKTQVSPRKVLGLGILEEKNDENYPLGFTEFLFFRSC